MPGIEIKGCSLSRKFSFIRKTGTNKAGRTIRAFVFMKKVEL